MGITPITQGISIERISRRHLHMLLAGKFISVFYRTLSPSGDVLGQVFHGGTDINLRMIEAGMARVNSEARLPPGVLLKYQNAERVAQARKQGLWQKSIH